MDARPMFTLNRPDEIDVRFDELVAMLDRLLALPRNASRRTYLTELGPFKFDVGPVFDPKSASMSAPAPALSDANSWLYWVRQGTYTMSFDRETYWAAAFEATGRRKPHGWWTMLPTTAGGSDRYFSRRNGGSQRFEWSASTEYALHLAAAHQVPLGEAARLAIAVDVISELTHEAIELIVVDSWLDDGRNGPYCSDQMFPHPKIAAPHTWAIDVSVETSRGTARTPVRAIAG